MTSVREIVDLYGLPFEATAKTLQRLKQLGWIDSAQGAKGGYRLSQSLKEVSLAEYLRKMEGEQSVVPCCMAEQTGLSECAPETTCSAQTMMRRLNQRMLGFLSNLNLAELMELGPPSFVSRNEAQL